MYKDITKLLTPMCGDNHVKFCFNARVKGWLENLLL